MAPIPTGRQYTTRAIPPSQNCDALFSWEPRCAKKVLAESRNFARWILGGKRCLGASDLVEVARYPRNVSTSLHVSALREQVKQCAEMGSQLYAELLSRAAADLDAGGVVARLLADWRGHPVLDALPMRLMGAAHWLVLEGSAPELATHYPSVGGRPELPEAADAFIAVLENHEDWVRARLDEPVQTNEVRRSAALLGGFLHLAETTGLPLRLFEIGASAGLNLFWDHHRYALGPHRWGNPQARLRLETDWRGPAPALDAPLRVVARRGCDLSPVDLSDPGDTRRLESFLWADRPERLDRFRSAADVVRRADLEVERGAASLWLERVLEPAPGTTSVLFQSVMWWYLSEAERAGVTRAVHAAGERSRGDAPLAWLRMEGASLKQAELRVSLWPGGEDRLLGTCEFHGAWVRWH